VGARQKERENSDLIGRKPLILEQRIADRGDSCERNLSPSSRRSGNPDNLCLSAWRAMIQLDPCGCARLRELVPRQSDRRMNGNHDQPTRTACADGFAAAALRVAGRDALLFLVVP
jgi:hypothetical protein